MSRVHPSDIVNAALAKGEMKELLLGAPEYQYRSRWSPAPGNTDLTDLPPVLYREEDPRKKAKGKEALLEALYGLTGTYEGIDAIATCILFETGRRARGLGLDLPIDDLATKLQTTIRTFEARLRADKSGMGYQHPDGLFGDLRRLSHNTEGRGGPSFCK